MRKWESERVREWENERMREWENERVREWENENGRVREWENENGRVREWENENGRVREWENENGRVREWENEGYIPLVSTFRTIQGVTTTAKFLGVILLTSLFAAIACNNPTTSYKRSLLTKKKTKDQICKNIKWKNRKCEFCVLNYLRFNWYLSHNFRESFDDIFDCLFFFWA
jgi:hypothetical protein